MSDRQATVVTVTIAGEQYTLRAHASPEYTRQCAEYLDEVIREIRQQVGGLDPQRVAILAGLALADQLLQERKDVTHLRTSLVESMARLNAEIAERLASTDLAAPS
jgi:cell division protein ZapA (FtsZ GTPase activity inhibitor)